MKFFKPLQVAIASLLFCTAVNAQDFKLDGIYYDFTSDTTVGVSFYIYSLFGVGDKYKGDIVIPSQVTYEGKTYDVTSIVNRAFNACPELTGVTIPNSVTSIGIIAFKNSPKLTSITIPESVTTIGTQAFNGCKALKEIKGSFTDLAEIGANAFDNTEWFNNQPDGLMYIGKNVYCYKGELTADTTFVIAEGTRSITSYAFAKSRINSEYILGVTIPESVTSIGEYAFQECSNLESIVIPDGVKEIAQYTFQNCYSLEDVTIGDGVTSIGNNAFQECSSIGEIVIPDNVVSIGDNAFNQCSSIESVTLGASLTDVGKQAFLDCFCLENITMRTEQITVGEAAFHNTAWYDSKPAGLIYMGEMLYSYKGDMPENSILNVKEGTKSVAGNAFAGCTNLAGINMPETVTSIGNNAFKGCVALKEIVLPDNVKLIGKNAFDGCSALESVTFPDALETLDDYAFQNCTSIESVSLGNTLKTIGASVFKGCTELVNLTLSEGLESIGHYAFSGCESLLDVTIPNSVKTIGTFTFRDCVRINNLVLGSGLEKIDNCALYNCANVHNIYMMCETPPETSGGLYSVSSHYDITTLHVPKGTVDAYRAHELWSNFKKMEEHNLTGIGNIEDDKVSIEITANGVVVSNAAGEPLSVYDVVGKPVEKISAYSGEEILLGKGIYIISVGGKSVKIVR